MYSWNRPFVCECTSRYQFVTHKQQGTLEEITTEAVKCQIGWGLEQKSPTKTSYLEGEHDWALIPEVVLQS